MTTALRTYRLREDVAVWEPPRTRAHGDDREGYWRDGMIIGVGPGVPGPPPLRLPGLPAGHVRIFLREGRYPEDMRGQTITHDMTDPRIADLVRRPDDNDGSAPR